MKIQIKLIIVYLSLFFTLNSCVTRKELTYLKYSESHAAILSSSRNILLSETPSDYKILPYDNLYIRVITPDPQWSELFNTMPVGAGGAVTEESAALFGYPVNGDGYIDIPFVGQVMAGGKTLSEIKAALDSVFKNYVTDAAITVRLVNNYVSILGEVAQPGKYRLTKDRANVFEVLAMAGDIGDFGTRQKVQMIRPSALGSPVIVEFSLTDRSILSSDLYYVMPNDIIYAMPAKGRAFRVNSAVWTLFLSTITSALGVIGFFRTL
jgi:polysaccharide export outer membrane protein